MQVNRIRLINTVFGLWIVLRGQNHVTKSFHVRTHEGPPSRCTSSSERSVISIRLISTTLANPQQCLAALPPRSTKCPSAARFAKTSTVLCAQPNRIVCVFRAVKMEFLKPCLSKGKYNRVFDIVAPVGTSSIDSRCYLQTVPVTGPVCY